MSVLMIVLFLGFLSYSIFTEARYLILRRNCTVSVSAQISDRREAGWSKHGRLYRCTVSYSYNGVRYSEDMAHTYRRHVFSEGEPIEILVDENNPSRFMCRREKGTAILNLVVVAIMIVLLIFQCFQI